MANTIAILAGYDMIYTVDGALQIYNASDVLIPADNISPNTIIKPLPSRTCFRAGMVISELNTAADRVTKFVLKVPYQFAAEAAIGLWQPFCQVFPSDATSAAKMVSSAVYMAPTAVSIPNQTVTVSLAAIAGGGGAFSCFMQMDFKYSAN